MGDSRRRYRRLRDCIQPDVLVCRTEIELAQAIHGDQAYQQRANQDCNMLLNAGKVERRGDGGAGDPFRYWPV